MKEHKTLAGAFNWIPMDKRMSKFGGPMSPRKPELRRPVLWLARTGNELYLVNDVKAVVHDLPQPGAIDQLAPAHAAPSPRAVAKPGCGGLVPCGATATPDLSRHRRCRTAHQTSDRSHRLARLQSNRKHRPLLSRQVSIMPFRVFHTTTLQKSGCCTCKLSLKFRAPLRCSAWNRVDGRGARATAPLPDRTGRWVCFGAHKRTTLP
jgi:hypothetical protein